MISLELWTTIRYLHAQGISKRKIAVQLGISRNTVAKALSLDKLPKYERKKQHVNLHIAPFESEIQRMALEQKFIGTRILREIRTKGYKGSKDALYRYLRKLKADHVEGKPSVRFETGPGQQAQFDWSPYTISTANEVIKVVVFSFTLGYSRLKVFFASLNETQVSVFEAIESALWFLGGAPKELLVDNHKNMVDDPRPGHFKWNSRFLELCGHYRMKPVACRVGNPRTKGKVENPFYYLEEHFIRGNTFLSFEDFCERLERFSRCTPQQDKGL